MMKYHGYHIKAKEMIGNGRLGQIVMGRAQLTCWYPPIEEVWRQDPARGGALMDMAIHFSTYRMKPQKEFSSCMGQKEA